MLRSHARAPLLRTVCATALATAGAAAYTTSPSSAAGFFSSSSPPPKSAVVVGVSHAPGVGYAVAKRFAQGGLAVGIVGRQQARLDECKKQIEASVPGAKVTVAVADATDPQQVTSAL